MRTKTLKINGKDVEAVLMAGGPGFKIYGTGDGLAVDKGGRVTAVPESHPSYKAVIRYVNLGYATADKKEEIKKEFQNVLERL
jgi:hypothetical protein